MSAKFEILRSSNQQFYFNLKAPNGEIILTSELYKAKNSAEKGIVSLPVSLSPD